VPQFIEDLGAGKFLGGIPNDLVLWAPIAIVIIFALRRTGYGRLLYAIGDNSEACNLAGIRVWRILVVDYVTCSLLAAAAGLVIVGGTDSADLSLADVYLLPSVAAVIIGGDLDLRRSRRIFRHHYWRVDPHRAEQHSYPA
jgi:ribose transport system permease protein